MKLWNRGLATMAAAAALFAAGVATGAWQSARIVAAQNKFGQPKTVVHVVVYKWKNTTSQNDKDLVLAGIKSMAGKIPGIRNIWLKTERNQMRDFDGLYSIEFARPAAPPHYPHTPPHVHCSK